MAHNEHLIGVRNQLGEGVCDHAGFDLGALFNALGDAAVKFIEGAGLDRGLIAASSERHIQRLAGGDFAFSQRLFSAADTDRKGDRKAARLDLPDVVQNREPALDDLFQMLLFNDHQKLFAIVALDEGVGHFITEVLEHTVHRAQNTRFFALLRLLHQFVIVVQNDQHNRRAGLAVKKRVPLHLGHVDKIEKVKVLRGVFLYGNRI